MKSGRGGKREGAGRPAGSTSGKKERISINIEPENLEWLKKQAASYSKVVNRLIEEKRNEPQE